MLGDFITRCLILLLGYAYPGFECYKTVENSRAGNDELRFWCQYWLPMYGELKLALFIYLWYPKTKGTGYVYNAILRPYVSSHENDIEKKFREWRARAWDLAIFYWQNCTELGQATTFQILDFLAAQSKKFSSKSYAKKKEKMGPTPSAPPLSSIRDSLFENNYSNSSGRKNKKGD
ncbi:HVA22-like protein i isoform X2 [Vigna angularis]|uniref:HVA22-like protein i isoform X2 n=1 Tax=Phaseolus angularis TaxID=3914 RepID=UPI00080A744B|nr:HVA22-like protein i isoform X2 [Vigna angularis]